MARPWTPPDTDTDAASSPRHDYFSDPYRPPPGHGSPVTQPRWARGGSANQEEYTGVGARCDTPSEGHQHLRPKRKSVTMAPAAAPYTPTKSPNLQFTLNYGNAQAHGLPQYPYTPDSSRIVRRSTERPLSPIPWHTCSSHSSSPVQNALSSCIAHFENLLQTRQPDEDQLEYIVGQFEAMASYLSAPDGQSQGTGEHKFTELQNGLGITSAAGKEKGEKEMNEDYVAEVGRYIESVRGYITDLKMRLDEVKMLNSIQLDVIQDLRSQMQSVKLGMQTSLWSQHHDNEKKTSQNATHSTSHLQHDDTRLSAVEFGTDSTATLINPSLPSSQFLSKEPPSPSPTPQSTHRHVTFDSALPAHHPHRTPTLHNPQSRSVWSSFAEALDQFGALLFEQA